MNNRGIIIKNRRLELKISQKKLAEKVGITQPFMAEIESGRKNPSMETLDKICDLLSLNSITLSEQEKELPMLPIEIQPEFKELKKMLDNDAFNAKELEELKRYAKFLKDQRKKSAKELEFVEK